MTCQTTELTCTGRKIHLNDICVVGALENKYKMPRACEMEYVPREPILLKTYCLAAQNPGQFSVMRMLLYKRNTKNIGKSQGIK